VEIGDDVLTADRVFIGDTYHDYRHVPQPVLDQPMRDPRPVSIGAGAFLGINSVILPGVTIGEGAYVAAAAVVNRDVPPRSLVAGNPARVVRHFDGSKWVEGPPPG
jgi:acetyltransferase-like isoleucine patch superfamily enzyme